MGICKTGVQRQPVIDLHNDLLSYLATSPSNSPYDAATGTSVDQMRKGGVLGSVLVAFAPTPSKSLRAEMHVTQSELQLKRQVDIFRSIPKKHPEAFSLAPSGDRIVIALGVENCSSFISEEEPLKKGIERFQQIFQDLKPLYVSLTWNEENRLGGGIPTHKGLTDDGKVILDLLKEYTTAVDLSHASDQLSIDILNYLEKTQSPLKVIASHANFRAITDVPRNLPDEVADEIARRGGVIGLTFIRSFIGPSEEFAFRHIEHGVSKGWEKALAIGADFFTESHLSESQKKTFDDEHFFPEFSNASCYPAVQKEVTRRCGKEICEHLFFDNANRFFRIESSS